MLELVSREVIAIKIQVQQTSPAVYKSINYLPWTNWMVEKLKKLDCLKLLDLNKYKHYVLMPV